MINVISYNLKIKSLKERYVFLTEILKGIDRNQISYEDIFSFLNQKCKKRLIDENKNEIKERGKGHCSCEEFINICIEVEDNLCYLIQDTEAHINSLYAVIEESKKRREDESFNYRDNINEESYLLIHILDASNFSPGYGATNSLVYVDVKIDQSSNYRTKELPVDQFKVNWNEPLRIPITQNDLSKISSIRLIVNDQERERQKDFIGSCMIKIDPNTQNIQEFNENIISKNGQRLQSFLRFRVKLVLSQEKVYSDAAKKIEYEMKNLHENLEKYEFRLRNLREYFELPEETKKELPKTLGPNYHCLWAKSCEERLEANLESIFKKFKINSVNLLYSSSVILALLTMVVCFLRANFSDLVISFGLFAFVMPDHRTFNHFYMRCWLILMFFSVIVDIVWLALFTSDWNDYYDNPVNTGKTIVLVFSYLSFFFKLFYWIIFWKCSVRSQNPDYNFERDFRAKFEPIHEFSYSNEKNEGHNNFP